MLPTRRAPWRFRRSRSADVVSVAPLNAPAQILFIVPDLRIGGAERHVSTLAPRMDPRRFRSTLVCIGEEGELFDALPTAGVDATAMHLGGQRNALRALRALVSTVRRVRPDIIVLRGYNAEVLGRIAARVGGVKHTIVWVHNNGDIKPRGRSRRALDRWLTRWTSAYFGVAEVQRDFLVGELGYPDQKIRIIHNGVDPQLFSVATDRSVLTEFGFDDGDAVVGIVAALRPEKDHLNLLRAAHLVVAEVPQAKFLIVGDGPTRDCLERAAEELDITKNVHFAGARRDVARLLCAMDVFTLSSVTVECFPIALIEAMACGRPAVCTSVGGIPELLVDGETGYLVPPENPQLLAARIIELLANPVSARHMGRAGRDRVEAKFNLDLSVVNTERAFEEILNGRTSDQPLRKTTADQND